MPFGQVVVGPPGSGKTTYCNAMHQYLNATGRETVIVNLDPANENIPYKCAIDIREIITVDDIMAKHSLGPNGAMIFAMEMLLENIDWLLDKISELEIDTIDRQAQDFEDEGKEGMEAITKGLYWIFDFPGQIELYTHHSATANILERLKTGVHFSFTAVQLVDSYYCSNVATFMSVLLSTVAMMLNIALPHVNILSKLDLIESMGLLDYNLAAYTDLLDIGDLLHKLNNDPLVNTKFRDLNRAVCDVVESFQFVSFVPFCVEDRDCMAKAIAAIDKGNGYVFGAYGAGTPANFESLNSVSDSSRLSEYESTGKFEERYMRSWEEIEMIESGGILSAIKENDVAEDDQ